MDQFIDPHALRLNRIDPVRYPLPKVEVPKRGAYEHMSLSELQAALRSSQTFKH
jgi:hypothetical protein